MSFELISKEKNVARVKLVISKEDFEKAIQKAYNKNKSQFNIPGFRKGKAPLAVIESKYGKSVFYDDAIDEAFPDEYIACLKDGEFEAVAAPTLVELNEVGENGATLTIDIALNPEFEVAEYKGIKTGPIVYTFDKADLDEKIKELQDKDARLETLEDEASQKGDTVVIDFEGFVDDVAFEGGKGEDYPLTLGSNTFIPGFEDQLIGFKGGNNVDVKVTFPTEYHAEDLAGKDAVFKVTVKAVQRKQYPEVDDEFAIDLGYESLEEMNAKLKEEIETRKADELKNGALNTIMFELLDKTEIDLPPMLIKERTEQVKEENDNMLRQRGIEPEAYYKFIAMQSGTEDTSQFMEVFEKQAIRELKTELISKKIIELENIEVAAEDLDKELARYAEASNQELDAFKENVSDYIKEYIEFNLKQLKMYDFLLENADTSK